MRVIGPGYIDYWQGDFEAQMGLTTTFGIRVQDGFCSAVNAIDGGRPLAFGRLYQIPVRLETLPNYVRMIIDDHLMKSPNSDLMDVLHGKKSFRDAVAAPTKMEVQSETGASEKPSFSSAG